jgi:hypothetical protein
MTHLPGPGGSRPQPFSTTAPVGPGPGRELAESGHGLYMVGRLAECLDWQDEVSGRTIHAILGTPPADRSRPQADSPACEPARLPQPA